MHQPNVLIYGPSSFISTLDELKSFLKFNHFTENKEVNFDLILFHTEALNDTKKKDFIKKSELLKIYVSKNEKSPIKYDGHLLIPTTINEINSMIEKIIAKKKFYSNSSIKVKNYLMDKNQKKLSKERSSIILTEKEIKLIELLLNNSKPISKDTILSTVWNYSADADTHTVETHIYRLRKKISDQFMDDEFIINKKDGYSL
mgnify:CR=1 FL=1